MDNTKDNTDQNQNDNNDPATESLVTPEQTLGTETDTSAVPTEPVPETQNGSTDEPPTEPAIENTITPSSSEESGEVVPVTIEPAVVPDASTTVTPTDDIPTPVSVISPAGAELNTVTSEEPAPSVLAIDNPAPATPGVKKGVSALVVGLICLLVGGVGGFVAAAASGTSLQPKQNATVQAPEVKDKELQVPQDATVIAECAKGRGKQFVLPKDIPQGPVYNVYNGKVVGIEYMLSQKEVAANKDFLNLPLEGVKYDHINIGLLSKGHSGYPEPHYHVDVFTISHDEASKITCQ